MNRLFVHQPLFRLISPVVSGVVIYLLILLINNNVGALEEQFLGQEVYLCIGLSYLIQEFSRLALIVFSRRKRPQSELFRTLLQLVLSIAFSVLLVTTVIWVYYRFLIGFDPILQELLMFNGIFCMITLIYISLSISHDYMQRTNHQKLQQELGLKEDLEADFRQFKRGINPQLLFESLESLIVLLKVDKEKADEFLDHLAKVYRYILSRKNELVPIRQELEVVDSLVGLFNSLPNRQILLGESLKSDFMVVPGTLLHLTEGVIRGSIATPLIPLRLSLSEDEEFLFLTYPKMERIEAPSIRSVVKGVSETYGLYSDGWFDVVDAGDEKIIKMPKLFVSA